MQKFIKWASGSATKTTEIVGPHHDPYHRDIVDLELTAKHGRVKYRIVCCALAGEWLECNGRRVAQMVDHTPFSVDGSARRRARSDYEAEVSRLTGFDTRFWIDMLWWRLDKAFHKRDPAAYEMQEAMDRAYSGYM